LTRAETKALFRKQNGRHLSNVNMPLSIEGWDHLEPNLVFKRERLSKKIAEAARHVRSTLSTLPVLASQHKRISARTVEPDMGQQVFNHRIEYLISQPLPWQDPRTASLALSDFWRFDVPPQISPSFQFFNPSSASSPGEAAQLCFALVSSPSSVAPSTFSFVWRVPEATSRACSPPSLIALTAFSAAG